MGRLTDDHDPVPPPVPLPPASLSTALTLHLHQLASPHPRSCHLPWPATPLACYAGRHGRPSPAAQPAELGRIRQWITTGVTLDFVSEPAVIDHDNTFSVLQNAVAVRTRIAEYIEFEALVPLPAGHPCPYGVQPLHVIIKAGKKPRLVIDLSRNLNDHLEYWHFRYASVLDAVERSFPGCWFGKLDLSNCFLSFPLHSSVLPHFIFRFEGQLYQFLRGCPSA